MQMVATRVRRRQLKERMGRPIRIDRPEPRDGATMWRIARSCGLDPNSPYKYLLFCRDFPATSAIARVDGLAAGFVTGYVRPGDGALFIWQIGVLDEYRHQGLGLEMLREIWQRLPLSVTHLEASVTPSNEGSRRLFVSLARDARTSCTESLLFAEELFPEPHEPEILLRIGPRRPVAIDDMPAGQFSMHNVYDPRKAGRA